MANWIMHIMIAERLLAEGLHAEAHAFCIGSIAPDCNIENEDWTAFVPSREVTHWMRENSKLSADYEGFYQQKILNGDVRNDCKYSFLLGYYAHLMTDAMFAAFIMDPVRVKASFRRLKNEPAYRKVLDNVPQTHEELKRHFNRRERSVDLVAYEKLHVINHPDCLYNALVRTTTDFPDEWADLPSGAIARKIRLMAYEVEGKPEDMKGLFFSKEELDGFIEKVVCKLRKKLINTKEEAL